MNNTYKEIKTIYEDLNNARLFWDIGKGLQKVDNLFTSEKLDELISEHLKGKITYKDVEESIIKYHKEERKSLDRFFEADVVATRVASSLNNKDFRLTKNELLKTHEYLFKGLFDNDKELKGIEGKIRRTNIEKEEDILGGKSVIYTDYKNIEEYLDYDLEEERNRIRTEKIDDIKHLSKFVSNLWNTHPFREGNTRTTAVFIIRYLRANGIDVTNDLFKENSLYFRNALVLASDNQSDIPTTYEYIENFFTKLLVNKNAKLKSM